MIESITGSKVKVKILRLMLDGDRNMTLQEIVRALGLSTGCAYPAIKDLEKKRILLGTEIGRSILYSTNKSHILYNDLKNLFDRERSAFKDIAEEYAQKVDKRKIVNIILFGSVARGDTLDPGDIDILEITEKGYDGRSNLDLAEEIEKKYDVHLALMAITKTEVNKRIRIFDNFMISVLNEGITLYGDDAWFKKGG
jgi:predicted nucleotidyltransferase